MSAGLSRVTNEHEQETGGGLRCAECGAFANWPCERQTPMKWKSERFFKGSSFGLVAAVALIAILVKPASGSQQRPNILFIFADDERYRSGSSYGYRPWSWVSTPNLDRLAAEGVRFEYAYVGSWCAPSRAMLLTGLQPHAINGYRPERKALDPEVCRFWPAKLRASGYQTAFIGKWHVEGYDDLKLWNRDWDHWVAWDHTRSGNGGYYGEKSKDGTQRLNIDGSEKWVKGYPTDNYTDYAAAFIKRQHRQPW